MARGSKRYRESAWRGTSSTDTENASVKDVSSPLHPSAPGCSSPVAVSWAEGFSATDAFFIWSRVVSPSARWSNSLPDHSYNPSRMTMADDLVVDMNYSIMTVNSQIIYKPTDDRNDPEPDNDHEVYVGNLPAYYTIEKFVNFAK